MVSREDIIRNLDSHDRRWVARCQMGAVFLFLALFAGVILCPVIISGESRGNDAPQAATSATAPVTDRATPSGDEAAAP